MGWDATKMGFPSSIFIRKDSWFGKNCSCGFPIIGCYNWFLFSVTSKMDFFFVLSSEFQAYCFRKKKFRVIESGTKNQLKQPIIGKSELQFFSNQLSFRMKMILGKFFFVIGNKFKFFSTSNSENEDICNVYSSLIFRIHSNHCGNLVHLSICLGMKWFVSLEFKTSFQVNIKMYDP